MENILSHKGGTGPGPARRQKKSQKTIRAGSGRKKNPTKALNTAILSNEGPEPPPPPLVTPLSMAMAMAMVFTVTKLVDEIGPLVHCVP